jgi:hypothetical protein
MKKRKSGFKGFRRKSWFVGDPVKRAAHDGQTPLTRTWREGEPIKVYSHRLMGQP